MQRKYLGEFEEIVLLLVSVQYAEAYGLSIAKAIKEDLNRSVTLSSVHTALYRLEEKGFVSSALGKASKQRGGRRKRVFTITTAGKEALLESRQVRNQLWARIPKLFFEN